MPTVEPESWFPLNNRSLDLYVEKQFGWRMYEFNRSQPTEISVTSVANGNSANAQIQVWPSPDLTAINGYPCIGIYSTSYAEMDATDDLPAQIMTLDFYVDGMSVLWAKTMAREDYGPNRAIYEDSLNQNVQFVKGLQVHEPDEVSANPIRRHSRVT